VKLKWIADNLAGMSITERDYWTEAFPGFAGTISGIKGEIIVVSSDLAGHTLSTNAQYIEKV
jgi:hypothetical protein